MNPLDWLSGLADSGACLRVTLVLLHFLWLGSVICLIAAVAGWRLRNASAAARYLVNAAALLLMAACLPATFWLITASTTEGEGFATEGTVAGAAAANASTAGGFPDAENVADRIQLRESLDWRGDGIVGNGPRPANGPMVDESHEFAIERSTTSPVHLRRVAPYVTSIYLLGLLVMFGRLTVALWGGRLLRVASTPLEDQHLLEVMSRQARRLGLRAAPAVAYCERIATPVVVGIIKPMILLPLSFASGLTPRQLASLLTHELAHIRRYDLAVNLLQRAVEAALFFHPAVWLVSRQVSVERENCCDDLVLAAGHSPLEYADALVRMAEVCAASQDDATRHAVLLAASGDRPSQFKRRILRLLGDNHSPTLCLTPRGLLSLAMTLTLLAALPWMLPTWAIPPGDETDRITAATARTGGKAFDRYGDPLPPGTVARMGAVRLRQTDIVFAVKFSPDGRLVASAGDDSSIRLWETATGKPLRVLRGHARDVRSVDFSPDGKRLASAGVDDTLRLWELATGREAARFEVKDLRSAQYTPNGRRLVATCGMYATRGGEMTDSVGWLRILDAATGKELRQIRGHNGYITSVSLSKNGKTLATASHDNTVRLWDMATGGQLRQWQIWDNAAGPWLHHREQFYAAISPDGKRVAFSRPDCSIQIRETATGKLLRQIAGHEEPVNAMAFSPDGRRLVTGGCDDSVRLWDVAAGQQLHRCQGHQSWVQSVAFSPRGTMVASGGQDYTIRLWNTKNGKEVHFFPGHQYWIFTVALSPDGRRVATGGGDGLYLWEAATGKLLYHLAKSTWVRSIAFSPDGKTLVADNSEKTIREFDVATGQEIRQFRGHAKRAEFVRFLDGKTLISAGRDRTVRLWDVPSGKMRAQLPIQPGDAHRMEISADGKTIATVGHALRVNEVATGKLLRELDHGHAPIRAAAFSPDGAAIATAGSAPLRVGAGGFLEFKDADSTAQAVRLWDLKSGKEIRRFDRAPRDMGHTGHAARIVEDVAISPDGKLLITAESDGAVLLYDLATGWLRRTLRGHQGQVNGISFSASGTRLATAGANDLTALVWEMRTVLAQANGEAKAKKISVDDIIGRLRKTEASIRNLSVTTNYVKLQQFLLPVKQPVRMELITKAIVDHTGRAWNDCVGEQVNIEPDGKSVRIYKGRWRGAFDGTVARRMSAYGEGAFTQGSLTGHLSWHGINPREFTTHYFRKPVSELLKTRGANVAERSTWDKRPVVVVDTIPRGETAKRKYRFWIDLGRGLVVRRALLIQYKPDQKWQEYTRIESRGHKQIKPGIWLPMQVKYESVEVTPDLKPEKLSWSYTGTNSGWKVNQELPKETFVLKFPDGIRVNDHRVKKPEKKEPARKENKTSDADAGRGEFAVWLARWQAEQKAIEEIKKLGGTIETEVCAPEPLREQLGDKRSRFVTLVNMMPRGVKVPNDDWTLEHVKHFTQLRRLFLRGPQVNDAELEHLTSLTKLEVLYLWAALNVTDKGFAHLRKIPSLTFVHCSYSGITDDALAGLSTLKRLTCLDLPGNSFTDKALANVSELTGLKVLTIVAGEDGNITDDGIVHLKKLTNLESLNLMATSITDQGLEHLKGLENMKTLWLNATGITSNGAAGLQQALPKLQIKR